MTIIDLHPEELIDRAGRGELSEHERAHLNEHVARCSACRFELMVREDLSVEAGLADTPTGLYAMVSSALDAAGEGTSEQARTPRPQRARTWSLLVAAAILLMTGMAAAQLEVVTQAMSFVVVQAKQVFGERERVRRKHAKSERHERERGVPAKRGADDFASAKTAPAAATQVEAIAGADANRLPIEEQGASGSADEGAPLALGAPTERAPLGPTRAPSEADRARAHAPGSRASAPRAGARQRDARPAHGDVTRASTAPAGATARNPVERSPEPNASERSSDDAGAVMKPSESPAMLFERANGLRRQGHANEARALYRYLESHFGKSSEGRLALAVLGRLELDRGDARAALRDFEAYLATGDAALREEVLAGRALAHGRLGQTAAECAAFDALLRAYPESSYRSLAERRCGDLD